MGLLLVNPETRFARLLRSIREESEISAVSMLEGALDISIGGLETLAATMRARRHSCTSYFHVSSPEQ